MPTLQVVHAANPIIWKLPDGHELEQDEDPAILYDPAGHVSQTEVKLEFDINVVEPYKPAGQLLHVAAPMAEYNPALQSKHKIDPKSAADFPAGQVSHVDAPVTAEKVPTAHTWHVLCSVLKKLPGEHTEESNLA